MQLRSMFLKCSNGSNLNFMCRMVLEWREHEHGDVEEAVRADLMALQVFVSLWLKGQTKTATDASRLLGS